MDFTVLKDYILSHADQIIEDTLYLVNHQSPSANKAYADRCADALTDLIARRLQAKPDIVFEQQAYGPHFFYRIGTGRPKALLIGHYDTVWDPDILPVIRQDNVLYGPGVYDMKYGLVAGIWAVKAIRETGLAAPDECVGLFYNSDEEPGSLTSRYCLEQVAKEFEHALVLEPSKNGALKVGRKAVGTFHIKVGGVAAHAGTDYTSGRSAILEAAYLTQQLFAMTDLEQGTTVNVGTICGGTKTNVFAASVEMDVDVRVKTMAEAERLTKQIQSLQPTVDGCTVEISGSVNRPPMEPNAANMALFEKAKKVGQRLGMDVKSITVGGGSDGNFTSAWGIPTLDGLGPMGDGAHGVNEHILIRESLENTVLLTALLQQL